VGESILLTDLGESAVSRLIAARRDALSELVDGWSPEQHDELAKFLTHMAQQLMADPVPVP
jgi:DNA-binding MarR family transcriptional regulator